MNETAIPTELKAKRRIKAAAPTQLQTQVVRKAKIIRKHAEVLGPLGMQAIQIATLQVVATKLEELRRLLVANGVQGTALPTVAGLPPAPPPPPKVLNPCVLCGRPGAYQMRTGSHGWYCAGEHANWARGEDGEELISRKVSPSTSSQAPPPIPIINQAQPSQGAMPPDRPAPTPGIANALRMLTGGEEQ
jgi:hypothetical protein